MPTISRDIPRRRASDQRSALPSSDPHGSPLPAPGGASTARVGADEFPGGGPRLTLEAELVTDRGATVNGSICDVAISPDSKQLVALASGGEVHFVRLGQAPALLDAPDASRAGIQRSGFSTYRSVSISPDGKLAATGEGYSAIHLWDLTTRRSLGWYPTAPISTQTLQQIRFEPDGQLAVTSHPYPSAARRDGEVTVTRLDVPGLLRARSSGMARLSRALSRLAGREVDAELRPSSQRQHPESDPVYGTRKAAPTVKAPDGWVATSVRTTSPDGRWIAAVLVPAAKRHHHRDVASAIGLFDARSGELVGPASPAADQPIRVLTFTPDGRRLISAGDRHPPSERYEDQGGGTLKVWALGA
jgi:WD40 repeat protein